MMEGEIAGLFQAILIMFIAIVALAAALSNISTNYSVATSPDVQALVDVANNSTSNIMAWTNSSAGGVSANDWAGQVYMLTSGVFSILVGTITTIPMALHAIFTVCVNALMVGLPGVDAGFTTLVVSIFETILLLTILFAIIYVITKVKP